MALSQTFSSVPAGSPGHQAAGSRRAFQSAPRVHLKRLPLERRDFRAYADHALNRETITMTQANYLVAELTTLVVELRNPKTVFSRDQLADLAERARADAAALGTMRIGGKPVPSNAGHRPRVEGGAQIIPLFGSHQR